MASLATVFKEGILDGRGSGKGRDLGEYYVYAVPYSSHYSVSWKLSYLQFTDREVTT